MEPLTQAKPSMPMECPRFISRCFSSPPSDGSDPFRPVAKVILSSDPLHSNDDDSPTQQFLKDILKELCIYNNKGANQVTYEFKPEYKRSGESTAK